MHRRLVFLQQKEYTVMFLDVETENGGSLADGVSWDDGRVHLRFGAELTVAE